MRNIVLFLLLGFSSGSACCQDLYLIFDKDVPFVEKDIHKYMRTKQAFYGKVGAVKLIHQPWSYNFAYPLYGGGDVIFEHKVGTLVQTILLPAVDNYPAKTIAQLDTEMQSLVEYDYMYGAADEYDLKTIKHLHSFNRYFVIELDKVNQQAFVVEVTLESK